jgi:aminoglycoside phosphotransferase (APT) family kinase protein
MLPQPVVELLQSCFPEPLPAQLTPTVGGFSHLAARLNLGGRAYVVKAADAPRKRADLRHEATLLRLLQGTGLPVPMLVALAEDEAWTVEVQEQIDGEPGVVCYNERAPELPRIAQALGVLLARIHSLPLAPPDEAALLQAARVAQIQQLLPQLDLAGDLQVLLQAVLAHSIWQQGSCLVHGDAGIHNILWDGQRVALLDWEWSAWGTPLADLAWVAWTLRWRQVEPVVWQAFVAGYGPLPPAFDDAELRRTLVLGQMAAILPRVQHMPPIRAEWLRRIAWTLGDTGR